MTATFEDARAKGAPAAAATPPAHQALARPTGREEAWRFTPLDRLRGLLDGAPGEITALDADFDLPAEVEISTDKNRETTIAPADILAAHAVAQAPGSVTMRVPKGVLVDKPLQVALTGRDASVASYAHLVLDVEEGAGAVLVLSHRGSSTTAAYLEILVGDGADVTVISLHETARDAVLASRQAARLGRDARLRHVSVTLGGDLVRVAPTVEFTGPGGDVELSGVWLTDGGQHHESRLLVEHTQPNCRSRVTYKGALQGEGAHSVWIGDVIIRASATGTDTYELNRNLVLTDGARADSVPNLEIETGEVTGAGHASATGRFDENQLFYLMSRGIDELTAKRLVVKGFFAEVLERVEDLLPDLHDRVLDAVEARL